MSNHQAALPKLQGGRRPSRFRQRFAEGGEQLSVACTEAQGRLAVEQVHVHWPAFRDAASYVGLFALLVYWMRGWRARGTD